MAGSVAYLGPAGTFTEQAVHLYMPDAVLHSFSSIHGVALAVVSGIADEGVVPIENSLQGSVNETLDVLISQRGLFIRQELVLPIVHCLLVIPDTEVSEIEVVLFPPPSPGTVPRVPGALFPQSPTGRIPEHGGGGGRHEREQAHVRRHRPVRSG